MTNPNRILLAVSGGIAVYKAAELVRLLKKQGAEVRVMMTEAAQAFVGPLTFQALSGHPVSTELLDPEAEQSMGHIHLARWADLLLIAPATANTIAKCRLGLADDLLSTLYLAAQCPVYMAPAMNQAMWRHPATQENVQILQNRGVILIGPEPGEQACGETGPGRMAEPALICDRLFQPVVAQSLAGAKLLITAGPTREPLDPVRYITNRSSGKMGYAVAKAAVLAGAKVTLVSGPTHLAPPEHIKTIAVETAAQMYEAVMAHAQNADIYVGAAAVADYTPAQVQTQKIKKNDGESLLLLHKTRDILAEVASLPGAPFTVGFAAETQELEQYAQTKLRQKHLDMIAANWVGKAEGGFDKDNNALQVFWPGGQRVLPMMSKSRLAEQLIALIAERWHAKNTA